MAINAQKLLPPAKLSTSERMAAAYDKKIDDLLNLRIKKKLINVEKITKTTKKTKQETKKKKKIREENETRKKKEQKLEEKQPTETTKIQLPSLPKTGLLDSVQNFLTYTFLGYMFTNYSDKMSPLAQVVKILPPALNTFGTIIRGTVDVAGGVIEDGYKFKDDLSQKIKEVGGEDAQKTYDTFTNNFKDMINRIMTLGIYQPPPTPQKVNGGLVTRMATGGVTRADRPVGGPVSRQVQTIKEKKQPVVFRQKTEPGKDIGGTQKIERIFPKSKDIQKPGPLNTLMTTSSELKKIPFIGSLMSAAVDIAMGQRPDKRVYQSFGEAISNLVGPTIEGQSSASINNLTSAIIKMASGGPVPLNRQISSNTSSSDRLAIEIAKMFQVSVENRLSRIFSEILKTSPASFTGASVPPAELSDDDRKASDELIKYFSKLYGEPAAIGIVANLLRESGLRTYAPEGGFYGMAQWDDNRWSKLTAWAQSKGKDPMSRSTQAEYIAVELEQSGTAKKLKNSKSPDEAASIFYNEFERGAYSKPVVGESAYKPDNPHEQKNRSFIASLAGSSYEYVAPGKVKPVITSRFGEMRVTGPHGGSDLAVPEGTPLRAISDGEIIESDFDAGGWGHYLVFKDSKGIYHLYGHMQSKSRTGSVKKGDIVGLSGSTGRVTGPHLHWEAGTGYKGRGILTGKFDPLNRYSMNAPFNTTRVEQPTKKPKPKEQASTSVQPQSADIATAKPKILNAANQVAMLPSYDQPETILLLQEKIILKESGSQNNPSSLSNISFPGLNSTSPTFVG